MKLARLIAVTMLLSLPSMLVAQRTEPAGVPGAQIVGTISSVSGSVVKVLGGLVAIEASNAQVLVNGAPATVGALTPGDLIFATFDGTASTPAGTLVARTIVVQRLPEGTLTGLIDALDADGKTLVVEGIKIKVTAETSFGGTTRGARVDGLSDLHVNELVSVALTVSDGILTATRIQLLLPVPDPAIRLNGIVKTITSTAWTITDGRQDIVVTVTPDTRIVGEPRVGDKVEVLGNRDQAGAFVATSILKVPSAPPLDTTIVGSVKSIGSASWTITDGPGKDWVVLVASTTRISGSPAVGDRVEVVAYTDASGSLVARSIVKLSSIPVPSPATLSGTVRSIGTTSWTITDRKGDHIVLVTAETRITGSPQVGDLVEVTGTVNQLGVFTALTIVKPGAGGR